MLCLFVMIGQLENLRQQAIKQRSCGSKSSTCRQSSPQNLKRVIVKNAVILVAKTISHQYFQKCEHNTRYY